MNHNNFCSICHRLLNVEGSPLSINCGGDCWGCVGECEFEGPDGENEYNKQVYEDIRIGLRDANGMPLK